MDWARVCHASRFRLFKNSTRTVEGVWYFAPEKTPFYPYPHPLGRRDFFNNIPRITPVLGETFGAREFYSGEPPAVIPLPVLVGDKNCISEGLDPGTVSVKPRSPFCGRIMPDACYEAIDVLDETTNHKDCVFGFNAAVILDELGADLAGGIDAANHYFGDAATITGFERAAPFTPRSLVVRVRDHCFTFCEGTQMWQQWITQISQAAFGATNIGTFGTVPLWNDTATLLLNRITLAGGNASRRFVFVGHSLGGASCAIAAARIKSGVPTRIVELVTFGSPKPGDDRLAGLLAKTPGTHYVNEGDPVPYVPPKITQWDVLTALLVAPLPYPSFPFVRHHRQVLITSDRQLKPIRTEEVDDDVLSAALRWLLRGESPYRFDAHSLSAYTINLGSACPCLVPEVTRVNVSFEWIEVSGETTDVSVVTPTPPLTFDCGFLPGGVTSQWKVTFSGMINGSFGNAADYNGTWTLDYVGGCIWRFTQSSPDIRIDLGRSVGWWNLALPNLSGVQWRNNVDMDGSSPKTLTLEGVPAWGGDWFGNSAIPTITIFY